MAKLNFEKNLEHQSQAVQATIAVFEDLKLVSPKELVKNYVNPQIEKIPNDFARNIRRIREEYSVQKGNINQNSNIIDIKMETGTGKTYTYTKTIFELNKLYGIFKFIIVVPTLSIKAGTEDFLKSDSARDHFKELYGKTINLHVVGSQKSSKGKRFYLPSAITNFVNSGNYEKNQIQVMLINAGMINSETLQKTYDTNLFDKFSTPFDAISATLPILIIDEPHKFTQSNKTWENILKTTPQFILRYGATFPENKYENLIYELTAVDAFNKNLVKGVIGHITQFENNQDTLVRFINSDGTEAVLELIENGNKITKKFLKKSNLKALHSELDELIIEKIGIGRIELSNGIELTRGDKINPYSYSEKIQEMMIKNAIKSHFELEKQLLSREIRIKPLTLFFIDNIEEYRKKEGYIRKTVENIIKSESEKLLKKENNSFYKKYLEITLNDISKTHGGYFSKDNSESDESIEQEVIEILHSKETLLSLNNPRRFIFSKWTLREGWDNPNVFQICKLRSSGSEISKLQEVGRGLRLPVNEYGNRIKDEQFYLNYFVDFTENDFVDKLVKEINEKSGSISLENSFDILDKNMINLILDKYSYIYPDENNLLNHLDSEGVIKRSNEFKEGGINFIKDNFPLIFTGVGNSKIRKDGESGKKVTIRTEKYNDLKILWEKLNQKVILEYKIENETKFKELFKDFIIKNINFLSQQKIVNRQVGLEITNSRALAVKEFSVKESNFKAISTLRYDDFIKQLSESLNINIKTIHEVFLETEIQINDYLNSTTIKILKQKFDNYLLYNAIDIFSIEYQKVSNKIHPTKLTDSTGEILNSINSTNVGLLSSSDKVPDSYLFNELFFDSELEKENIIQNIKEVIVFTKIPKGSIKIPISGGKSYSPDFAYVLNYKDGEKKIFFVVETKNLDEENLRKEELQKIRHAEKFFGETVKIKFNTQFNNKKISDLIEEIYK